MGGGYKGYYSSTRKNYWLSVQIVPLQRIYSGASGFSTQHAGRLDYYFNNTIAIGQISNNVYFGSHSGSANFPIMGSDSYPYSKYNLLDNATRDVILDLLPESWLMYMKNEYAYDYTQYIYQYSHDDLVADGIEQS